MQDTRFPGRRPWLAAECVFVFGGLPVLAIGLPESWWPWLLALAGAACIAAWSVRTTAVRRCWLRRLQSGERSVLPLLLRRFAVCALTLGVLVWLFAPERFLSLPREHAAAWMLLVVSYPLFSVLPQEVIYRYLFRLRYGRLFAGHWILPSAMAFAWLHIALMNVIAPLLTLVAGWFFAQTYRASRSLRLAVAEHTLYGVLVFSIGLDPYFLGSMIK